MKINKKFELSQIHSTLDGIEMKIGEPAGLAVRTEVTLRIIGQFSLKVQDELKKIVDHRVAQVKNGQVLEVERLIKKFCERNLSDPEKEEIKNSFSKKTPIDTYWDCDLELLEEAIINVFGVDLPESILNGLEKTRKLRNKLLHGNFVKFVILLGFTADSRQHVSVGVKLELERENILEAAKMMARNTGAKALSSFTTSTKNLNADLVSFMQSELFKKFI